MSDNTELNPGTGGDVIRTVEIIDRSSGTAVSIKTQVVIPATASGIVDSTNPLPTEDVHVCRLLEAIVEQQAFIIDQNDQLISQNKQIIALL